MKSAAGTPLPGAAARAALFSYPPQGSCPHGLSPEYEWVRLSGKGKVLFVRHLLPGPEPVPRGQGALQRFVGGSRRRTAPDQQRHRGHAESSDNRYAGGKWRTRTTKATHCQIAPDALSCCPDSCSGSSTEAQAIDKP